jgi:hypothetical protein
MVVHCFGSVSDVDADNVKLVVNRCQEATDLGRLISSLLSELLQVSPDLLGVDLEL